MYVLVVRGNEKKTDILVGNHLGKQNWLRHGDIISHCFGAQVIEEFSVNCLIVVSGTLHWIHPRMFLGLLKPILLDYLCKTSRCFRRHLFSNSCRRFYESCSRISNGN